MAVRRDTMASGKVQRVASRVDHFTDVCGSFIGATEYVNANSEEYLITYSILLRRSLFR